MPAVLTHDFFGREFLNNHPGCIANSEDARNAFLLGNQGPDPLFYLIFLPGTEKWRNLGDLMHDQQPTKLIASMAEAVEWINSETTTSIMRLHSASDIAKAYALGFVCHYTLDSTAHPFVYAFENAVVQAGIEGIGEADGGYVHCEIERMCDECVLYRKTQKTILEYKPYKNVLHGNDFMLAVIGNMYSRVCSRVYELSVPADLFPKAVHGFRLTQRALYAPGEGKRYVDRMLEKAIGNPHSRFESMAHQVHIGDECMLDNHEQIEWANPFTGELSSDSFYDRFDLAQERAEVNVEKMEGMFSAIRSALENIADADGADDTCDVIGLPEAGSNDASAAASVVFDLAEGITKGLNFSGKPAEN